MTRMFRYLRSKRDDILLFAASLAISLVLFIQVQSSMVPDKEREFDVPLTFSNARTDLSVLQAPRTVKVVASGSQSAIDSLDTSRVRAFVDLADAAPGRHRFPIEVTGPLRPGLTFTTTRPVADMSIERKIHRKLAVELHTVGTPPLNYRFDGAAPTPDIVDVSGPESIIGDVRHVRAILDLSLIAPNKPIMVDLEALDDSGRPVPLINFDPSKVLLNPAVSIGPSRRSLLVTPVFRGHPPFGYKVIDYTVTPSQVDTTGESSNVSRLTTVDTEPIELGEVRSTTTFTVKLLLPDGLSAANGDEVQVTVSIARS